MPVKPTSHTELSTLSTCEMRWFLRYVEKERGETTPQMYLGTLLHESTAHLLEGRPWSTGWPEDVLAGQRNEEPWLTAAWLLDRYARYHVHFLAEVEVVANEQRLYVPVPGSKSQKHECVLDSMVKHGKRLWVREAKSYGRTTRVEYLMVDPQLTLNLAVAREHYEGVAGILFDGIYTHRFALERPTQKQVIAEAEADGSIPTFPTRKAMQDWAREQVNEHPGYERPLAVSFHQDWMDRTPEHTAAAWAEVCAGISRRNALKRTKQPQRSIGQACGSCAQRGTCWERLAFPLDIELDMDETAA